jgi:hypothetical protein
MDGVYISEKVGAAKPSPKLLDYAIRDLGLTNRSRVLMVGDDLLADIKGGINAGIDTCWVNFANEENKTGIQPKYTVHSYEELYRIVMEPEELENVSYYGSSLLAALFQRTCRKSFPVTRLDQYHDLRHGRRNLGQCTYPQHSSGPDHYRSESLGNV